MVGHLRPRHYSTIVFLEFADSDLTCFVLISVELPDSDFAIFVSELVASDLFSDMFAALNSFIFQVFDVTETVPFQGGAQSHRNSCPARRAGRATCDKCSAAIRRYHKMLRIRREPF